MDRSHVAALRARKAVTEAQAQKLLQLLDAGVTDPCTHPEVTPAVAQLWYKHAAPLRGEGEHVTAVKMALMRRRSDLRDQLCRRLSAAARHRELDAFLGGYRALDLGDDDVAVLGAVAWKWLQMAGLNGFLDKADEVRPATSAAAAAAAPEQLMEMLHSFQKTNGAARVGVGFDPCGIVDRLAIRNGWWSAEAENRHAAILVFLVDSLMDVHECVPYERVVGEAQRLFGDAVDVHARIDALVEVSRLARIEVDDEGGCALTTAAKVRLARDVIRLAREMRHFDADDPTAKPQLLWEEEEEEDHAEAPTGAAAPAEEGGAAPPAEKGPRLTAEQRTLYDAVVGGETRLAMCCAPAGTGKTHTAAALAARYPWVLCLAPTWKAIECLRQRMPDHVQYMTVQGFFLTSDKPPAGLVLVDETSMVTLSYVRAILQAVAATSYTQLVFLGDDAQLPCIGAGRAITDLTLLAPTYRLTRNLRTGAQGILDLAHHVRTGGVVDGALRRRLAGAADVAWTAQAPESAAAVDAAVDTLGIHGRWSCEPWADDYVQVITHRNDDVAEVNRRVQRALGRQGQTFSECYVGDAVRITANTDEYKNGMEGQLVEIRTVTPTAGELDGGGRGASGFKRRRGGGGPVAKGAVRLRDGRIVLVAHRQMEPGFASTVHKVQGSEYAHVRLLVTSKTRLTRELLYTAVTRAKSTLGLCGTLERLAQCPAEHRATLVPLLLARADADGAA